MKLRSDSVQVRTLSIGLAATAICLACSIASPPRVMQPESSTSTAEASTRPQRAPWSDLSREARNAMRSHHYGEAEAAWVSALTRFENSPASDARLRATLSNLVRLASIYQRLERSTEADRVMSTVVDFVTTRAMGRVTTSATRDRRDSLGAGDYTASYHWQSQQPLDEIYRPQRSFEARRRDFEPSLAALIRRTARKYQVDPHLVKAVVAVESNFNVFAESEQGAQGLMQLMPATARELGVHAPFRPSANLSGGVRYLRSLLDRYPDISVALAAYNAGPVAVERYGGVPPYPETEAYVKRVLEFYREYRNEATQ